MDLFISRWPLQYIKNALQILSGPQQKQVLHLLNVSFSEYEDFGRFAKDQSILPSGIS